VKRKHIYNQNGVTALAKRIKEVRKLRNFTQEELAYRSGLTLSQIARIETARTNPTISTIFKIAKTLDISLAELFDFDIPGEEQT